MKLRWPFGKRRGAGPRPPRRRRKRWKILGGFAALLLVAALVPVAYVEIGCRGPAPGPDPAAPYRPVLASAGDRRPEARSWLTYPEWYIVYSAESYGRFLETRPPSGFPFFRHIAGFWSSYCAVNRATAGRDGAGETKVMIYTIGLSYSAELAVKGLYEKSIGRLFEWVGGWRSEDDRYSARVQQRYGAFMHETPWYAFPFGTALSGLWETSGQGAQVRHWERRLALSAEYGFKALYAKLIGWASGATLGRDETRLRLVVHGPARTVAALDPRLRVLRDAGEGRLVVEAPRYAQFTELALKLSRAGGSFVEIAGNDDVFVTVLLPPRAEPRGATRLFSSPLDERPGWRRAGMTVKVAGLAAFVRAVEAAGGRIEHVYDY